MRKKERQEKSLVAFVSGAELPDEIIHPDFDRVRRKKEPEEDKVEDISSCKISFSTNPHQYVTYTTSMTRPTLQDYGDIPVYNIFSDWDLATRRRIADPNTIYYG